MRKGDTRLTLQEIKEFKRLYKKGWSSTQIGEKFKRNHTTILFHLGKLKRKPGSNRIKKSMFKNTFRDVKKIKFGSRDILNEAMLIFDKLFYYPHIDYQISDKYGIIANVIGDFILVAKSTTFADVVSVSKKIWTKAIFEKKYIVMYIQSSGYFYKFNPNEIKDFKENMRGDTKMVNFSIKEGKNLIKLKAIRDKIDSSILKNRIMKIKEEEEEKNFVKNVIC